ncbi:type VI secretion system protein TssA [Bowmanella sp. Y26]|uniref:type VI secretion system protein TssA n=1 Tax=Bowmanella yangjiangensis TaxID=2811230 RepID=UPI001BDC7013|nr:type VI secretion system protein TssA [Bowmanella yangjiangensis]MBT1063900.1 type VI secretion system protein TssA [Bowmanella yangjiangensis]
MTDVNISQFLTPISDETPAGDNLEYEQPFTELERLAKGKPEQSFGDAKVDAEPPDWRSVKSNALTLLERSRDLRLAIFLCRALLNLDGVGGLRQGLQLTQGLLLEFWPTLHPQLDPEDDNDPALRINTLQTLCDREATLSSLLRTPLASSRIFGAIGLRQVQIAKGQISDDSADGPDLAAISATFMDCPIEDLRQTADDLNGCQQALTGIDNFLNDTLGASQAPDLCALKTPLTEALAVVNEYLARRGQDTEQSTEESAQVPEQQAPSMNGEINSREDATRQMDRIIEYFRKHEPSSPVPLLLQRAKRLATLDFLEILRDMAPEGLQQARNVGGLDKSGLDEDS